MIEPLRNWIGSVVAASSPDVSASVVTQIESRVFSMWHDGGRMSELLLCRGVLGILSSLRIGESSWMSFGDIESFGGKGSVVL